LYVIQELMLNGAVADNFDEYGFTAIHWLMQKPIGHKSQPLQVLKMTGADLNVRQKVNGMTALQLAVFKGCKVCVQDLIAAGIEINQTGVQGQTALHIAARKGDNQMIKVLIQAGADCDIKDDCDETAAQKASKWGHKKCPALGSTAGNESQVGKRKSPNSNATAKRGRINLEDTLVVIK